MCFLMNILTFFELISERVRRPIVAIIDSAMSVLMPKNM